MEERYVGPPGTGKTSRCAEIVAQAVKQYGSTNVVVSSLTKAAAATVAQRVTLPPAAVSTLHSHAHRSIGSPDVFEGYRASWAAYSAGKGHSHFALSPDKGDDGTGSLDGVFSASTPGEAFFAQWCLARLKMQDLAAVSEELAMFGKLWTDWKAETEVVDFVDQIDFAYLRSPHAPGNPAVLVIDEAQDMSRLEWALVRKWGAAAQRLVVVGDPAQCLYAWRGADPQAFFDAPAEEVTLDQSYRVPRAVHSLAMAIVSCLDMPRFDYKPRDHEGSVRHAPNIRLDVPGRLVADVARQLAEDPEGDCMVLTSCNYMLADIVPELRRAGILWHNPYRLQHNGWNPLHGARPLAAFLAPQRSTFGDQAHAWTYDELDRWTAPLSAKAALRHGAKAAIHTEGRLGDQTVPTMQLLEWFEEAALARAMDGDIDWWWDNLTTANQKRQNLRMMVSMTHKEPATLSLTPRVIVGTIHSVKGGEATHVWLFPDLSQKGQDEMDNGDADSIIRQYYVGVTRARDSLVLCGAAGRRKVSFW